MVTVTGLFETHLTVQDLARSIEFYRDVVGMPVATVIPERRVAFMWVGGPGEAMLGLWEAPGPMGLRLHFALRMAERDVIAAPEALRAAGVEPLGFFGVPTDQAVVYGWMPAVCVFFRDPDGHSVEYLSMLDARPQPEIGIVTWSQWLEIQQGTDAASSPRSTHDAVRP